MKEIPSKHFQAGERLGVNLVTAMFDDTLAKAVNPDTYAKFGAHLAGVLSSALYHAHQKIEQVSVAAGDNAAHADRWLQLVFNVVAETMAKQGIPVEIRFLIARKEKK